MEGWRSPRKIEEDIRLYRRKRFEFYMELVELGLLSTDEAVAELRAEIEDDNPPTEPISIILFVEEHRIDDDDEQDD